MTKRETKREKDLRLVRNQIARMEAGREAAIRALVKAENELPWLRRRAKRMADAVLKRQAAPAETMTYDDCQLVTAPAPQEDDIPGFLDRMGELSARAFNPDSKDEAARMEVLMKQEADKKRKAARRIEKLKVGQEVKHAELTGARRKMPLSGKAALAAIRKPEAST